MPEQGAWYVLEAFVKKHGGQEKAAAALGISQPYLCDLINQKKDLAKARSVLRQLGLKVIAVKA